MEKKKSKGSAFLTLKKPHSLQVFEWVHFTVSDKMACLQLPGKEKPFSFLQHEGSLLSCCQLLPPLPSTLVSCSSSTLGASAKTLLTFLHCCPLHSLATTSLIVYSHTFALLCHQSFKLFLLAHAESHFTVLKYL